MNTTNISNAAPSKLTVAKLKAWSKKNRDLAVAALKARAFAEVERERVDAYVAPIFARYGFTDDETGALLASPSKLYLSNDDERIAAFYAECDAAHRAQGYAGEAGTCPALVAEDLQRQADNKLLNSLAKFIGVDGFYTHDFHLTDGTIVSVAAELRGDWVAFEADGTPWHTVMGDCNPAWTCRERKIIGLRMVIKYGHRFKVSSKGNSHHFVCECGERGWICRTHQRASDLGYRHHHDAVLAP